MGGAAMVGFGLASAQPSRRVVLVVTGDGELLMGLGSLPPSMRQRPRNLAIVVLDNERYGETGMQPSATRPRGVNLQGHRRTRRVFVDERPSETRARRSMTWLPRI